MGNGRECSFCEFVFSALVKILKTLNICLINSRGLLADPIDIISRTIWCCHIPHVRTDVYLATRTFPVNK